MPADAIGLDIGGANLKAATASGRSAGRPFELWRHPDRLAEELGEIRDLWPGIATNLAITMTGELCDCFPTKRDGVRHILAAVQRAFDGAAVRVWSTAGRFLTVDQARDWPLAVAAANWHALATFAGRLAPAGPALVIDTGSTTTDVVPLFDGQPVPVGRTDPDRLRSGELVYTGARRTPVCALLGDGVAAEVFATAQDAYLVLGMQREEPDSRATADGQPMTVRHAHARLARMLGGDGEVTPPADTLALARRVYERQRAAIVTGLDRVAGRLREPPRTAILSGSGEFLARAAWEDFASRPNTPTVRVYSLAERNGPALSEAACAYALAIIAAETATCA